MGIPKVRTLQHSSEAAIHTTAKDAKEVCALAGGEG